MDADVVEIIGPNSFNFKKQHPSLQTLKFVAVSDAVQAKIVNYTAKWIRSHPVGITRDRRHDPMTGPGLPKPRLMTGLEDLYAIGLSMIDQEYAELLELLAQEIADGRTNNLAYRLIVFRKLRATNDPNAPKTTAVGPPISFDNTLQHTFECTHDGCDQIFYESKSLDAHKDDHNIDVEKTTPPEGELGMAPISTLEAGAPHNLHPRL